VPGRGPAPRTAGTVGRVSPARPTSAPGLPCIPKKC